MRYEVEIEGVAPGLLMHKWDAEEASKNDTASELGIKDQKRAGTKVRRAGKPKASAKVQAEAAAYRLENGELCQPAEHLYQALVKAATDFQVEGKGKKTYKDAAKGNLILDPEYISHGQSDYLIDSRPVRIQRARVTRHRPHLPEWKLHFFVRVINDDALPEQVLSAIIHQAGETIGIGDYRPRFGRFIVRSFKRA